MATNKSLDIRSIAKQFKSEVTKEVADFIEIQTKVSAATAGRRRKLVRSRSGKIYRYSNTGQLAKNIKKIKDGDGYKISDGSRSNYSDHSYHGMYYLVEKRGERDIKKILKDSKSYTESLKL